MNWAFQNSNSSVPEEVFGGELMIAEPASIIRSIENSSKSTSKLASEQTLGFRDGSAIFEERDCAIFRDTSSATMEANAEMAADALKEVRARPQTVPILPYPKTRRGDQVKRKV
jgi:hypothetical protein